MNQRLHASVRIPRFVMAWEKSKSSLITWCFPSFRIITTGAEGNAHGSENSAGRIYSACYQDLSSASFIPHRQSSVCFITWWSAEVTRSVSRIQRFFHILSFLLRGNVSERFSCFPSTPELRRYVTSSSHRALPCLHWRDFADALRAFCSSQLSDMRLWTGLFIG